ncbi:hypothetical protein MRX96_040160 [Rhipicephalus microplus]
MGRHAVKKRAWVKHQLAVSSVPSTAPVSGAGDDGTGGLLPPAIGEDPAFACASSYAAPAVCTRRYADSNERSPPATVALAPEDGHGNALLA